ncbi:MAG: S8 family serine peptidase [Thermoguttaceae bacterium]|jgi:hypothetical protein
MAGSSKSRSWLSANNRGARWHGKQRPVFRRALLEVLEDRTMLSSPASYTPDQIRQAYGIDRIQFGAPGCYVTGNGAGQTIAIIDRGDDTHIVADLKYFDQKLFTGLKVNLDTFGSYNGPVGGSSKPWFEQISVPGTDPASLSPNAATNNEEQQGLAGETSLDVEWAHAIAPMANILLVDTDLGPNFGSAPGASFSTFCAAAKFAASQNGVSVVSMSYSFAEPATSALASTYDADFTAPGVTFLASTGDNGSPLLGHFSTSAVGYPASSPSVVAVGGTTLYLNGDGSYNSETGWSFSQGISLYSQSGAWTARAGGYSGSYSTAAAGSNSTATWTTDVTASDVDSTGFTEVSATWTAAPGNATNATYTIYDNGTVIGTTTVNQTIAPTGMAENGAPFQVLGNFEIAVGDTLTVVLNASSANGTVVADSTGLGPAGGVRVLAPFSYSQSGTWTSNPGGFYGSYSTATAGSGATATWATKVHDSERDGRDFTEVSATWTAAPGNATNATYKIYDNGNLIAVAQEDQTKAPIGTLVNGKYFQELADCKVSPGDTLTVVLNAGSANGTVVADSVGLAPGGATGGGISQVETQPAYQSGVSLGNGMRATPDVAFDADPGTGATMYDSYNPTDAPNYQPVVKKIGGTSLSTPCWAGLIAIADQGRALAHKPALSSAATLSRLYSLPSYDFHDITTGYNGYQASAGYDLMTGLGTPIANQLVIDLADVNGPLDYEVPEGQAATTISVQDIGGNIEVFDNGTEVASRPLAETTAVNVYVTPSTIAPITVNNDLPTARWGIPEVYLDVNFTGTLGQILTYNPLTGDGEWRFTGDGAASAARMPISFTNIVEINYFPSLVLREAESLLGYQSTRDATPPPGQPPAL